MSASKDYARAAANGTGHKRVDDPDYSQTKGPCAVPDGPNDAWLGVWRNGEDFLLTTAAGEHRPVFQDKGRNWVARDDPPTVYGRDGSVRIFSARASDESFTDEQVDEVLRKLDADPATWPEPQPLPDGLGPVEPFDFALLPGTLGPWVQDIAERVQCPPDYVGAASITALAAALGRKIGIRPQAETDWTVVGNQWALIIGRPGVLKSPAIEAALAPLKRLVALACEIHETAIKGFERDKIVSRLRAAAAEKQAAKLLAKDPHAGVEHLLDQEEAEGPTLRRYLANDTTAAALGELLRLNPQGLLVHRDELVSLLRALDREDNAEARGFYLTAWNGDSGYTFDRIIRGMNLTIPAVCLSLLGSTQPGRIAEYIRRAVTGGAGDDGLIQRS